MSDSRGIFSLRTIIKSKAKDNWVSPDDVWILPQGSSTHTRLSDGAPQGTEAAYFAGGRGTYNTYKISYGTDTGSLPPTATLSVDRYDYIGTSSPAAGYFGGGLSQDLPGGFSSIDKIVYATDTRDTTFSGPLVKSRFRFGAVYNANAGYYTGGNEWPGTWPAPETTHTEKIPWSTETAGALPTVLAASRRYMGSVGNQTTGYIVGGTPAHTTTEKLTYSNDTISPSPAASFLPANNGRKGPGTYGTSTHGYFVGGNPGQRSSVFRLTYATETMAELPSTNLTAGRKYFSGTGNSTNGYCMGMGGVADKHNFATETVSKLLTSGPQYSSGSNAATSSTANAAPGFPIQYSMPQPTPTRQDWVGGATGPVPKNAYLGSGFLNGPSTNAIYKLDMTSDTTSPSTPMNTAGYGYVTVGNSNRGYWLLGNDGLNPPNGYPCEKLNYALDLFTNVPSLQTASGSLENVVYASAAGNETNGYIASGSYAWPNITTLVQKITYSTETKTPISSNIIPQLKACATGTQTHGYFYGGQATTSQNTGQSQIQMLTYATDTVSPTTNGVQEMGRVCAVGGPAAAYFVGGNIPSSSPQQTSFVQKYEYSTDNVSLAPVAKISRNSFGGSSSDTAGYFSGGYNHPYHSTTEKLDYSTDTANKLPASGDTIAAGYVNGISPLENAIPASTQAPIAGPVVV